MTTHLLLRCQHSLFRLHKTEFFAKITIDLRQNLAVFFFMNKTILYIIYLISTFQLCVYVQHWLSQPSRKFSTAPEWVFIGNA